MGQYYKALFLGKRYGNPHVLRPSSFGCGAKLMEHSWTRNGFVRQVLGVVTDNPMRVAWMGDYTYERYGDVWEKRLSDEKLVAFYEGVWGDEKPFPQLSSLPMYEWTTGKDGYLVNLDKRIYVDLAAHFEGNQFDGGWCVAPLPLLTACGNGRGGGDYHDCYPDYDKVGTWAFDLIELVQDKWQVPADCKEVCYGFKEVE